MKIFGTHISQCAIDEILSSSSLGLTICNDLLQKKAGIVSFFEDEDELASFIVEATNPELEYPKDKIRDRIEYGDFQTNLTLAQKICQYLKDVGINPKVVLEPTCGEGNFLVAALKTFTSIERIIGIEIYKPYIWHTKFAILDYYLTHNSAHKPSIEIYNRDIFSVNFKILNITDNLLILGNPPWVTNSALSVLESNNLPKKSNFKNHAGIEAITGKGNFDIGEYIATNLIRSFQNQKGSIALLVKSSVVRNILENQQKSQYMISNISKQIIDAQKEFTVATDAALFVAKFCAGAEGNCTEANFYTQKFIKKFGWVGKKFVSNIELYDKNAYLDGDCPFEWRQGVKHDCAKIMELERKNGQFVNGNGDDVFIEEELVYGLLKSSDLQKETIVGTRKNIIVTQKKIGQDTNYIQMLFPKTWGYLVKNKLLFDARKSSIYRGKPPFSIFGVGDYSFAPYKVAISSMYKASVFSLVHPMDNKPVMLDDTCYFIGFDNLQDAMITQTILNSKNIQNFLNSIIFWDAKRVITKDLLSRINISIETQNLCYEDLASKNENITYDAWERYRHQFEAAKQLTMF